MEVQKAAVIGAGVMGASIAAHITNAGIPVVLLDIVPDGATNRNVIAESAIQKLLKAQPAAFMHRKNAKRITPGNIEDHLELLADADWIVEAVIERLDIKHDVYKKINSVRMKGSVVSSNTSTIPLADLVKGMPVDFSQDFLITHFFNPPRYMRLMEIIGSAQTNPESLAMIQQFTDIRLGKGVVDCKDTPGFIGNRIGIYWLQCGVIEALELGLSVEEADAVMSTPVGIPKTGVFGLLDLVGLDLMPHIMDSMGKRLADNDPFHTIKKIPERIEAMIADGYTGRKGKGGFYRLNREGGKKVKESINLETGKYSESHKPRLDSIEASKNKGLRGLLEYDDKSGHFAWRVLAKTLNYAASLAKEISHDIESIDRAMKLGYNWQHGPFELIDQLGVGWFVEKLESEGIEAADLLRAQKTMYNVEQGMLNYLGFDDRYHPVKRKQGVELLSDIKGLKKPIAENMSSCLWDVGDGVVCLEFRSKMNSLDPDIMDMLLKAVELVPKNHQALVVYNDGDNFCVGANLGLLLYGINIAAWDQAEELIKLGQDVFKTLKYAPFPVVAAPFGMTLGGGCELCLHCDAIQSHSELYMGLVEVGVGVIPGWGGCKEVLHRWASHSKHPKGPMPAVTKAFELIGTAAVSKSAAEARDMQLLRDSDGISMNRDRLLADSKVKALALCEGYQVPEAPEFCLPGPSGKTALNMAVKGFHLQGKASDYDLVVSDALAHTLSGGDVEYFETLSEDDILTLERESFLKLIRNSATVDRIEHMLETGKPLRN